MGVEARIDAACVALVDLGLVLRAQACKRIDIATGIVEVMAGFRIDAADRADHLRSKENVVQWNDLEEQVDAGHGTREMPVWGPLFSEVEADVDRAPVRLDNLVKYLESIQVNTKT